MFSKRNGGFTLVELLTVIAIIAILAAILFPVTAAVRRHSRQTQCISNIKDIWTALKMFQQEEHRYPDFIAGPVQYRDVNGQVYYLPISGTSVVPLERNSGVLTGRTIALYPEYIRSVSGLRCPMGNSNADNRDYSTSDTVPDPMFATLRLSGILNTLRAAGVVDAGGQRQPFNLYPYSSYDYQRPINAAAGQVHYSTVWSNDRSDPEVARQLRWRQPPSDTLVLWCSFHGERDTGGTPRRSSHDLALFLSGSVKRIPTTTMEPWSMAWRVARP